MPILDSRTLEFFSRSADQTRRLGMRLGALLKPGDRICLSGDLGSGKTTLVQGIAKGWGSVSMVTSPTFVIVNEYPRPDGFILFHLDAYRLSDAREAEELDLDYMLVRGCLVVEWAEHIKEALPEENLWVSLKWISDEQRSLRITCIGDRYETLLNGFRQRAFGG